MAAAVPHSAAMSFMKRLNYFKKMPEDLTISTTTGSLFSIAGLVVMAVLFVFEFRAFLQVKVETSIEVDDTQDTMMRVHFNLTVDDMPCEFVSVDLTDATGTYEHNVTRHVRKARLSQWRRHIALHPDEGAGHPAYIQPSAAELAQIAEEAAAEAAGEDLEGLDTIGYRRESNIEALGGTAMARGMAAKHALDVHGHPHAEVVSLDQASLAKYVQSHDMVFVNFFAPWCHWCRELEPIWSKAASKLPELHYGEHVKLASVDCVAHVEFCREMHIRAFPTLLLYSDHTTDHNLLYRATRSVDAFLEFLETNAQRHRVPHEELEAALDGVAIKGSQAHGPEGCMVSGFLRAKKVPGTFHVKLHSPAYSHDAMLMNTSHVVHALAFGGDGERGRSAAGWSGILDTGRSTVKNAAFVASGNGNTFVHYHKVVCRMREYLRGSRIGSYSYTMHTSQHKEADDALPSIKFSYDLSPMKVVERETSMPLYHFVTSLCAIIGGFFTLLSMAESSLHYSLEAVTKKLS